MNRLSVLCLYNVDGYIYSYVDYLIDELKSISDRLIVVINGLPREDCLNRVRQLCEEIHIRENVGYDLGAYKHVICDILWEKVNDFDEIILCNDTFFGPFKPMRDIFIEMEERQADFWGLNMIGSGKELLDHVQSYFLVFRKPVVEGRALQGYFSGVNDELLQCDVRDTYGLFEIGIFNYLKDNGFSYDTYVFSDNLNIYYCPITCVEDYGLPIVKRKCFSEEYLDLSSQLNLLKYIKNHTCYDINYVTESLELNTEMSERCNSCPDVNLKEVVKKAAVTKLKMSELEAFSLNYKNMYIYGAGIIARKIWFAYRDRLRNMRGFLVSNDGDKKNGDSIDGYSVTSFEKAQLIQESTGIIIAMNEKHTAEVRERLRGENVLFLY